MVGRGGRWSEEGRLLSCNERNGDGGSGDCSSIEGKVTSTVCGSEAKTTKSQGLSDIM